MIFYIDIISCLPCYSKFFGSLRYRIISSANRNILTGFFTYLYSFYSLFLPNALARNSSTMLNRSGDSGHPCLVPDFRGNGFSFSPLSIMLAVGLSYVAFIMFSYFPSIPSFLRAFIMIWCWSLLKAFSASIEMIKWFLSLLLLMSVNMLILHLLICVC
jgi:hypothetical protein